MSSKLPRCNLIATADHSLRMGDRRGDGAKPSSTPVVAQPVSTVLVQVEKSGKVTQFTSHRSV